MARKSDPGDERRGGFQYPLFRIVEWHRFPDTGYDVPAGFQYPLFRIVEWHNITAIEEAQSIEVSVSALSDRGMALVATDPLPLVE